MESWGDLGSIFCRLRGLGCFCLGCNNAHLTCTFILYLCLYYGERGIYGNHTGVLACPVLIASDVIYSLQYLLVLYIHLFIYFVSLGYVTAFVLSAAFSGRSTL